MPAIENRFNPDRRRCLKCLKWFDSAHAGNRRCTSCERELQQTYIPKEYCDTHEDDHDDE